MDHLTMKTSGKLNLLVLFGVLKLMLLLPPAVISQQSTIQMPRIGVLTRSLIDSDQKNKAALVRI